MAFTALPGARAATRAFRRGGQLYVTAVVKGTFALDSDPMKAVSPAPIHAREVPLALGIGLVSAGDLAPCLPSAEVLVTGHVRFAEAAYETTFDIALLRDGEPILQKSADLERPAFGEPRARLRGLGPMARDWPARRGLFGSTPIAHLDAPIAELSDDLDWACFQAAPPDQRVPSIRGDETLVLGGFDPDHPFLHASLPGVRAEARLFTRASGGRHEPLALALDTLHVDLDSRTCSVLARGCFPVADPADLGGIHIVLGMAAGGAPLDLVDPFAGERSPGAEPAPLEEEEDSPFAGTLVQGASVPIAAALPFLPAQPVIEPAAPPPPAAAPEEPLGFGEAFLRALLSHDPSLRTALEQDPGWPEP